MNKRLYIKPEVIKIELDNVISIQMQSQPHDPPPDDGPQGGSKKNDSPFQSPFGNKPFS
jgi:hypothetical protein